MEFFPSVLNIDGTGTITNTGTFQVINDVNAPSTDNFSIAGTMFIAPGKQISNSGIITVAGNVEAGSSTAGIMMRQGSRINIGGGLYPTEGALKLIVGEESTICFNKNGNQNAKAFTLTEKINFIYSAMRKISNL